MNGPHDTLPNDLPPGEELLAYLDGELDAESRRRIEEQLSRNGELRQRLKEFQQTWDLLDALPRATVEDSFTRTTVEMVAIKAQDEVTAKERSTNRRTSMYAVLGLLGILAAVGVGFLATQNYFNEPNEQLVEDLPILEHFDAYRNAETFEFLRALNDQHLFQEETVDAI